MNKAKIKKIKQLRRHRKVRAKIKGTSKCPRLSVFRSNTGMFLQLINDNKARTLVSVNNKEVKKKSNKTDISFELGKLLAKKAIDKKIKRVVFDRGGYKYHGRVKAVAEGAREGGLKF